jgi:hypothetical protein
VKFKVKRLRIIGAKVVVVGEDLLPLTFCGERFRCSIYGPARLQRHQLSVFMCHPLNLRIEDINRCVTDCPPCCRKLITHVRGMRQAEHSFLSVSLSNEFFLLAA